MGEVLDPIFVIWEALTKGNRLDSTSYGSVNSSIHSAANDQSKAKPVLVFHSYRQDEFWSVFIRHKGKSAVGNRRREKRGEGSFCCCCWTCV